MLNLALLFVTAEGWYEYPPGSGTSVAAGTLGAVHHSTGGAAKKGEQSPLNVVRCNSKCIVLSIIKN